MFCHQSRANLEKRLSVPLLELIEDPPSGGVRQSLEDVSHPGGL